MGLRDKNKVFICEDITGKKNQCGESEIKDELINLSLSN